MDDPDPPDPETVTVSYSLQGDVTGCEISFSKDGNTDEVSKCSHEKDYEQNSGSVAISATADNRVTRDTSVSTETDHFIEDTLPQKQPKTVTKTFSATDAQPDTAITADFYHDAADTLLVADTTEAAVTFPQSDESIPVRAERTYFNARTQTVSLAEDGDVPFALDRQTVTVEVLLETMAQQPDLSEATVKIFEPFKADSSSCTGSECTKANLPKRSGQRSLEATNRDTHPETGDIRRYDPIERSFAASEGQEISETLEALPACSDGIDNEVGADDDGLVDVWKDTNGNGIPDEGDVGDPGCVSKQDDNEGHIVISRTTTKFNRDLAISSADGEREEMIDDHSSVNPLPASVQNAVGGILFSNENLREADEAGEQFYLKLNTGPEDELGNVTSTQTVADSDTIDGWHFANADGVDNTSFSTGTYYAITAVYDGPTDEGEIDITFLIDDGEGRVTFWSYAAQEEDHNGSSNSKAVQQAGTDCETVGGKKTCQSIGFKGYPEQ